MAPWILNNNNNKSPKTSLKGLMKDEEREREKRGQGEYRQVGGGRAEVQKVFAEGIRRPPAQPGRVPGLCLEMMLVLLSLWADQEASKGRCGSTPP